MLILFKIAGTFVLLFGLAWVLLPVILHGLFFSIFGRDASTG